MIILPLIYLAFLSFGFQESLFGAAWPFINAEFGVAVGDAGFVTIVTSCGTILSSLLAHRFIRRFGTRRTTTASVAITGLALVGYSFSTSLPMMAAFALPLGLGSGAMDFGMNEYVARHHTAKHMSFLHCFWGVGAMLGPFVISLLTRAGQSWRGGYQSITLLQAGLFALLLAGSLRARRQTAQPDMPTAPQPDTEPAVRQSLFAPLRIKGGVFALLSFFLYMAIECSMMLWGASFLVEAKRIAPQIAAGWISLLFLGTTAGRILNGLVLTKASNEQAIRVGVLLLIAGFALMLLPASDVFMLAAFLLVGLGLAPIYPGMMHQTPVYFGKEQARAAIGLQLACAYVSITLMPPLFGQVFAHISFDLLPYVFLALAAALYGCTARLRVIAKSKV